MKYNQHLRIFCCLMLVIGCGLAFPAHSETVAAKMPNGKTALARFSPGSPQKPAVLLLHGFLTTYNFNTILSAAEMLKENQITVLVPNLTLGINRREGGLACDAIHTHSIAQSVEEIDQWVRWLNSRGHQNIILLGHSQGGISLIAYGAQKPHPSVKGIITASLAYIDAFTPRHHQEKQLQQAKDLLAANNHTPAAFSLAYCQGNFLSPAKIYLDYMKWDQAKTISAINKSRIPVHIIMGSADSHFGHDWQKLIKENSSARLELIEGARHFLDGTSEFDFHDLLLEKLNP